MNLGVGTEMVTAVGDDRWPPSALSPSVPGLPLAVGLGSFTELQCWLIADHPKKECSTAGTKP